MQGEVRSLISGLYPFKREHVTGAATKACSMALNHKTAI